MIKAPLLSLLPQNPLNHVNEYCRLQNMSFEGLELMFTLIFFPWCKVKWSRDEFNNQSQILHGPGTTSWSMV
jgi:hypothetical protein